MKTEPLEAPPSGWGSDLLTDYFDSAQRNRWASFVHEREAYDLLHRIDVWLDTFRNGLINPKFEIPALLLIRAELLFRTSCELAMAGNHYAAMPVQRACIEASAYALWCAKDSDALKVWLDRDDSDIAKKAARNLFTHGATRRAIAKSDTSLADVYSKLYGRAIDFGAHPNPLGLWTNFDLKPSGDNFEMMQIGLHARGPALDYALKSSAQAGVFVIRIAELIWPTRVTLLGLVDEMWVLRRSC